MDYTCVGFLEISIIAKGIQVLDAVIKKAVVKILFARPVSTGKYLIGFSGEVEDVRSSVLIGTETAGNSLVGSFILPNLHPEIMSAFSRNSPLALSEALGIVELTTCTNIIISADTALKTSKVKLLKLHLAKGIGGKGYFVLGGEVADIEVAISAGLRSIQHTGVIAKIIIPQASPEILEFLHPSYF